MKKKNKEELNSNRGIGMALVLMIGLLGSIVLVGYSTYYVIKLFVE